MLDRLTLKTLIFARFEVNTRLNSAVFLTVDCRLEEWGLWGDCSASCGPSGFSGRVRSVEREAECGGTDCLEELRELRSCNRICMNGASLVNMTCVCGHGWTGACCERGGCACA